VGPLSLKKITAQAGYFTRKSQGMVVVIDCREGKGTVNKRASRLHRKSSEFSLQRRININQVDNEIHKHTN
jgi:hypothetical protein